MTRRVVVLALGALLVAGAAIALVGLALSGPDNAESDVASAEPEPGPVRPEVGADGYLDLWEQSRTGTYVARGIERRWSGAPGDETLLAQVGYHHARAGDRVLVVVGGDSTITEAGVTRLCQMLDNAGAGLELYCDQGIPSPSVADERAALRAEIDRRYVVVEHPEPGCVEFIGEGPVTAGRFGQSAVVCFDPATGALTREEVFQGDRRRELVIQQVELRPTDLDLDPMVVAPLVLAAGAGTG